MVAMIIQSSDMSNDAESRQKQWAEAFKVTHSQVQEIIIYIVYNYNQI